MSKKIYSPEEISEKYRKEEILACIGLMILFFMIALILIAEAEYWALK